MKLQIYGKVLKSLKSLHPKDIKGHGLKRVKKLAGLITGMIRYQSSHLSKIGKGLPQRITAYSKEKAAKCFLSNKWTDVETHYFPFLKAILPIIINRNIRDNKGIHLIIDGSKIGNAHCTLMISMVYRKRSIPLAWIVKKQPKGHFEIQNHIDLFIQVAKFLTPFLSDLPKHTLITVLGDGEFDSIELQEFCISKHWNYVIRTANNTVMYENDEPFKAKHLAVPLGHNSLFIKEIAFTKKQFKSVNFLLWHNSEFEQALPLISSLDCPLKIMEAYRKRYAIEALFKDLKSTSFNLHKTRLTKAYDISNLIMVAALAFNLLVLLADKFKSSPLKKEVIRIRKDRKEFSFYTFALTLLFHLIDEGIDFCFSTEFSKNST